MSEDYCGFLEPQEIVWKGESGKGYYLKDLITNCPRVLAQFDGVCGFSKHVPCYNGKTLFRFPLRKTPSMLSSKIYNEDMLQKLIESLKEEAQYLLVFLRSVCSIELYKITNKGGTLPLFKVNVCQKDYSSRLAQQRQLVDQIAPRISEEYAYSLHGFIRKVSKFTVEITDGSFTSKHNWLVVDQVGSDNDELLSLAEKLHVLPWVGAAIELDSPCSTGRIFCVLPLPVEDRAPFCVHVNGMFAVSTNRRSLKWETQERRDEEGTWNKLLVDKCLPSCYFQLISELMNHSIDPSIVYRCWPDIQQVNGSPWCGLLEPFYKLLLSNDMVVHTQVLRRGWISISRGVFSSSNILLAVKEVVKRCKVNVVEVDEHCWEAINQYYRDMLQTIEPALVKECLKDNLSSYCYELEQEKFEILKYCLSDNNFYDLVGLQLIPMSDGSFQKFQSNLTDDFENLYISSSSHPSFLLPGLEHAIVSVYDKDDELHSLLNSVASSGSTQLIVLDTENVASLLSQCDTSLWPPDIMSQFWKWLDDKPLSCFHFKKIVPIKYFSKGGTDVVSLATGNKTVYIPRHTIASIALLKCLEKCGIKFADARRFPYLSHLEIFDYLHKFEPGEVLDAMESCRFLDRVSFSNNEAIALQKFLSKLSFFDYNRAAIICKLALFKTLLGDQSKRYSINAIRDACVHSKAIAIKGSYDFRTDLLPSCTPLIIDTSGNVSDLLESLTGDIYFMQQAEYLQKVAFKQIRNKKFNDSNIVPFMKSVLDNFHSSHYRKNADQLISIMRNLPFVEVSSFSLLLAPCCLFDPEVDLLREVFPGEPKFPASEFHLYLPILRQCGLKNCLSADEIFQIVKIIGTKPTHQSVACTDHVRYSRAVAVLKYLSNNLHLFDVNVKGQGMLQHVLYKQASQYCWLPVASYSPDDYPSCLPWRGSQYQSFLASRRTNGLIVLSQDLASSDLPLIAGSQAVFIENVPSQLSHLFCSSAIDLVSTVVSHFKQVINYEHEICQDVLQMISYKTYIFLMQNIEHCNLQMFSGEWIWSEKLSKFISSSCVAVATNPSFRASLEPFIFVLSASLQKYSQLFIECGVSPIITKGQIISVLQSIKDSSQCSQIEADDAWAIVKAILDWIADDISRLDKENILVPVESDSSYPQLLPINEVAYTDNEILCNIARASDEDHHIIHSKVSYLSSALRLTPLSDQLNITQDAFEDTGQHEPLITRLINILREYKDGLTIIKEMIQNADDAGATEVNILYDTRMHSTQNLFLEGMAESHGPALIIHNNSTFTKEDFVNITKLASASKADQPLKIGKFGVGFCSVYHITDVPSFVSGEWLYIFDPTLKYLKDVVHNENLPGKKMKFQTNILARSDQLIPYQGLFGFDAFSTYNGTMFRLPFRTSPSQVSPTIYNECLVEHVKNDLAENGSKLLLFLRHVKCITFSTLEGNKPLSVEVSIKCSEKDGLVKCVTNQGAVNRVEYWLVSCHEEILKINDREGSQKQGIASVACHLFKDGPSFVCKAIEGNVFCFLPLSVPNTGLPVHISANFAVMSNRSGIWTGVSAEGASNSDREKWNKQLMINVIPKAYCNLLKTLCSMHCKGELAFYEFQTLWPLTVSLHTKYPWKFLISALCSLISLEKLFYSTSAHQWFKLAQSKFIPSSFFQLAGVNDASIAVFNEAAAVLELPVIFLSDSYLHELRCANHEVHTFTEHQFALLFLKNIELFKDHIALQNLLLSIILSAVGTGQKVPDKYEQLKSSLKDLPCIPIFSNGTKLKLAKQLIDPIKFRRMFDSEDGMFPLETFYSNPLIREAMCRLGLITNNVPWEVIICSARTIEAVYARKEKKALLRIRAILECLNDKTTPVPVELMKIAFLPVYQKPANYFLPWKGEGHCLLPPSQVMCVDNYNLRKATVLVGSEMAIVNTKVVAKGGIGSVPLDVLNLLEIPSSPSFFEVNQHFLSILKCFKAVLCNSSETKQLLDEMCRSVYEFYDDSLSNKSSAANKVLASYCGKIFIWTGSEFVNPSNVAVNWKLPEGPYLYKLHSMLSERKMLLKCLQIKEDFSLEKLLGTLHQMYKKSAPTHQVHSDYHRVLNDIIFELNSNKEPLVNEKDVILPDENYVLRPANQLSFNDVAWLAVDPDIDYVISHLNREKALMLGVEPYRSTYFSKITSSIESSIMSKPFGQKEDLTKRIRNILRDHPFDATILKELLQNADDAKANKMIVILDKRQHGKEKVPSDKWGKDLQGPAILVWNDKEFSDEHIKGIQDLGSGSKEEDDETIGQFGIGFNVVYHLTDCPSFITRGSMLCIFDPHCWYVPGANIIDRGRQYDIEEKFWRDFSDLRSCYLRDNILNDFELSEGVLFRFPLRCTDDQMTASKLVNEQEPLTADVMEHHLNDWVQVIKDSLLFLNHLTHFKYCTIDECGTVRNHASYDINLSEENHQKRVKFQDSLSSFREKREPVLLTYTLSLEIKLNSQHITKEDWFIQNGVGDVQKSAKSKSDWVFLKTTLPKHGIAAMQRRCDDFKGQVFCFLPLPIYTNFPVHINGQFILNTNRRSLWVGSSDGSEDNKTRWNNSILESIVSSYCQYLGEIKSIYIKSSGYDKLDELFNAVNAYYSLFPFWKEVKLQKQDVRLPLDWNGIGSTVLKALWSKNAPILASVTSTNCPLSIKWHTLQSDSILTQAFFHSSEIDRKLMEILESLGMILTCAPLTLYNHLLEIIGEDDKPLLAITPESVTQYYYEYCLEAITNCPCPIDETPFESVENFSLFLKFLLIKCDDGEVIEYKLSGNPSDVPLFVTADCQLRNSSKNILFSKYCHLFPHSSSKFLHSSIACVPHTISRSYFPTPENITFRTINEVMKENFEVLRWNPHLKPQNPHDSFAITLEQLKQLWQCLSNDKIFKYHKADVVKKWAIIPSTSGSLYNGSSPVRPIIKPQELNEIYCVLSSFDIPVYDEEFDWEHETNIREYCIELTEDTDILGMLYHLQINDRYIFHDLKNSEHICRVLFEYLGGINFRRNQKSLTYVKSLPLFETIHGQLTTIEGKKIFICEVLCDAGYNEWAVAEKRIFLNPYGTWRYLCDLRTLQCQEIYPEEVYLKFIFPKFKYLTPDARQKHLEYIRDQQFISQNDIVKPSHFFLVLCQLPCLEAKDGTLKNISYFSDHTVDICNMFKKVFSFVPKVYQQDQWLQFLQLLGLQKTVSKDKFKSCCKLVNQVTQPGKASRLLVSYLFSKSALEWHIDTQFLLEIGNIPFVQVHQLEKYQWIGIPYKETGLTKLNKAVIYDKAALVWTVKPVIQLPIGYMETSEYKDFLLENKIFPEANEKFWQMTLRKLGVTVQPTTGDVFDNLMNVCQTDVSKFSLFTKYTLSLSNDQEKIELVIAKILNYLFENNATSFLKELETKTCIPVSADNSIMPDASIALPVLVKPIQVVRKISSDCTHLFPYLHSLPQCIAMHLHHDLTTLGVSDDITLKTLQYFLEFLHSQLDGRKMDFNDAIKVREAAMKLYSLCKDASIIDDQLSPLYLPNNEGYLVRTENLVFIDSSRYRSVNLYLAESGYSLFKLPDIILHQFSSASEAVALNDQLFCINLPEIVRPNGLSLICTERLHQYKEINKSTTFSLHFNKLKSIYLDLCTELPRILLAYLKVQNKYMEADRMVHTFVYKLVEQFIVNVDLIVIDDLQVELKLRNGSCQTFGLVRVLFFFQEEENCYVLYIDTEASPANDSLRKEMAEFLCRKIALLCNLEMATCLQFVIPISECLAVQSHDELVSILKRFTAYAPTNLKSIDIGNEVPSNMHQLLSKDTDYVFYCGELVGYEKSKGCIIYAVVLQPSAQSERTYIIEIGKDDKKDVPASQLYKLSRDNEVGYKEAAVSHIDDKSADDDAREYFKPQKDHIEAERWLRQAEADLKAMRILNQKLPDEKVYCQVLFLAHEVCEKTLKAGKHELCGLEPGSLTSHELSYHANEIAKLKGGPWKELTTLVGNMRQYYLDSRFPNRHFSPNAPVDVYSVETTKQVVENTEKLYTLISSLIFSV